MRPRIGMLACAAIAVVGLGVGPVATPAQGAESRRHCVTDLSKPNAPTACYDSFRVAIAKATGGRITDAPTDSRVAMKDRRFQARLKAIATQKQVVGQQDTAPIAIFYGEINYQGNVYVYTGSRRCTQSTSDRDYSISRMPAGWDNWMSSYIAYRNCEVTVYDGPNFTGASLPSSTKYSRMGLLDNRTTSIIWS
jgi:hypothetical protein